MTLSRLLPAVVLAAFALPAALTAADPVPLKIEGNTALTVKSYPFSITAPAGADFYTWSFPDAFTASAEDNVLVVRAGPAAGEHRFSITTLTLEVNFDTKKAAKVRAAGTTLVTMGAGPQPPPGPNPPGPTPPGPTPGPTPPDPPPSDPSPFPDPGFRVLIVYDPANTTRPAAELSVITGKTVRDYLDRKCVDSGAGGKIWPTTTDVSAAPKVWADAFRLANGKDWIVIGDGKRGYSGPLPKSPAEALALLKKYGGE